MFHAIIDRLQDTPRPEIPKHPLSAIIVKPDMSQCKSPMSKSPRASPRYSVKSEIQAKASLASSASPSIDDLKQRSPISPSSSIHESHELVTTLSRLGVETEACSTSISLDGTPSKISPPKKTRSKGSPRVSPNDNNSGNVGKTYRETQNVRKRDSFIAMESAANNEVEEGHEADTGYDNDKMRPRIEWRFWKWSCKDVDKCRTMIVTARIFILTVVVIFNIIYWSIALGPE